MSKTAEIVTKMSFLRKDFVVQSSYFEGRIKKYIHTYIYISALSGKYNFYVTCICLYMNINEYNVI